MTTLQDHIIQTLQAKPQINAKEEIRTRINFLKQYILNANAKGLVLGISGGQDSALAGKLCQLAVNELNAEHPAASPDIWDRFTPEKPYKFIALLLPYGEQKDGKDAEEIAYNFIQADIVENFNIKQTVDAFTETYNLLHAANNLKDYHKGNVKARVRMLTQYAYAGENGLLVVGSDQNSEALAGFFSKFGDGGADLLPISGLNKRQGKELLRELGAPEFIFTKAPTADLLDGVPGQEDETELGVTYNEIDDYLEGKKVSPETQEKIENRYLATEHKRQLPVAVYDTWWK